MTLASLAARVAELEQIVSILANHSSHMMLGQIHSWKPSDGMEDKSISLEVRAERAAGYAMVPQTGV